jgi:hypothetical protein
LLAHADRGLIDWVVDWSTVAAAVLSAVAVLYAVIQSNRAGKAIVRERRLAHELGVIEDIAVGAAAHHGNLSAWQAELRGRLVALPGNEDMPLLRAFAGARDTAATGEALRVLTRRHNAARGLSQDAMTLSNQWLALHWREDPEDPGTAAWVREVEAAMGRRLSEGT